MSWRAFLHDGRGNIAVLFAMGFAVSAVVSALAVDAAALYHERRMIQNGVDLAALAAATDPDQAEALALAALVEAGLLRAGASDGLSVTVGHYSPDPGIAARQRFVPDAAPANAVRVSFSRPGTLHFARGWTQSPMIGATGLATVTPQVAFSVGSRLASLNGGIGNAVLNALLGTDVALTIMDYNGVAGAQVSAFAFLDALAFEMGMTAGTYDDLLAASADHGQVAAALAAVLTGAEQSAAMALASTAGHNGAVPIASLFELGELGQLAVGSGVEAAGFAGISALDVIAASAALGNGTRQVELALTAGVPDLTGIEASLAIGEPPQGGGWFAVGPAGSVVRTAQARLRLVATILGTGALAGAPIRLPLYLDLAHAEARVVSAACPGSDDPFGSAVIAARPGLVRLVLGETDSAGYADFAATPLVTAARMAEVKLLGLTVLQVLGSGVVEVAQSGPVALGFSSSDIAAGTVRTAGVSTPLASLTGSLLESLVLQAPILGLGLNLASLTTLIKTIVTPLAPVLDNTIARLLDTLGLGLGEVDVRVYGVRCSHPVLVG